MKVLAFLKLWQENATTFFPGYRSRWSSTRGLLTSWRSGFNCKDFWCCLIDIYIGLKLGFQEITKFSNKKTLPFFAITWFWIDSLRWSTREARNYFSDQNCGCYHLSERGSFCYNMYCWVQRFYRSLPGWSLVATGMLIKWLRKMLINIMYDVGQEGIYFWIGYPLIIHDCDHQ